MQSKNKAKPTAAEAAHIARIASMSCRVCSQPGPSEVHEIKQGDWWTSVPLCPDCHRGPINGLHGQRRMWAVRKIDELGALSMTVRELVNGATT